LGRQQEADRGSIKQGTVSARGNAGLYDRATKDDRRNWEKKGNTRSGKALARHGVSGDQPLHRPYNFDEGIKTKGASEGKKKNLPVIRVGRKHPRGKIGKDRLNTLNAGQRMPSGKDAQVHARQTSLAVWTRRKKGHAPTGGAT